MDYNALLDLCTDLGYRLAMSGAETFRVEESINLIMKAYGIDAESFAIPNNLTVSFKTPSGESMTRMRRIGQHGNDLDSVERYTNLSRRICQEKPDITEAIQWLQQTDASRKKYNLFWILIGNFLGAAGFSVFFGGGFLDCFFAGICGIVVGLLSIMLDKLHANTFFKTIISSFSMALVAYFLYITNVISNPDTAIIGTLMILVPGLLFTNAMRDIIYGDINSGVNRIVQVFLIAIAIALGTAASWNLIAIIFEPIENVASIPHNVLYQLLFCFIGCIGFVILFNIHGPGGLLCALGGTVSWGTYLLITLCGGNSLAGYFGAAIVAALYSEIMARIRKYPAISYLVISIFPLIPGAGTYSTMKYVVQGNMGKFAETGMETIAIAGVIAVGLILISTIFRMWSMLKRKKNIKRRAS